MKDRLVFIISGEHPTLPAAEVKAILEAENLGYRVVEESFKLLILEASSLSLAKVASRSVLYEVCGVLIFRCPNDLEQIVKQTKQTDFTQHIGSGESFAVRLARAAGAAGHLKREAVERTIGKHILEGTTNTKVDLRNPSKLLMGFISDDGFTFFLATHSRARKAIASRRARKRPVFHPATMQPKLARCMVNLARVREGQLLFDPFCGVGGILIEAGLINCHVVGTDVSRRMAEGSLRNLRFFKINRSNMLVADAVNPPLRQVDRIATDLPYGRGASTLGLTTKKLTEGFLPVCLNLLPRGGYLSLGFPSAVEVLKLGEKLGFDIVESHSIRVHRSLTRRIAVFRKR